VTLFCGIDWAETHHDVAIIDGDGQLVAKKRIVDDPSGFAELVEVLAKVGDTAEAQVPVAIETPRGLLVASLRATGRSVYPINPLAMARYPERHSVARSKSDHADAMTLANILRVDAHLHRLLPADSELCQAIAPNPAAAAKLSVSRIAAALRRAGRSRGIDQTAAEIKAELRNPNCANQFWSKPRWARTRWRCSRRSTPPATVSRISVKRLRSFFRPILTTRSSSVSRGWRTRPARGCSPKSVMTVPGSPTPEG